MISNEQKTHVNVKKSFKQIRSIVLKLKTDNSNLSSQSRMVIDQIETLLAWYKNKVEG